MIDDDVPGAGAGCPAGAQQVIVMQDEEPPCPSDAQRAHGDEAREVIVCEDYEPLQPSIFCKKPRPASVNCNKSRPADEQTPGRKDDARAGATAEKPSDPLFQALRPMCMRQATPTPLQPFTDVSQLQEFMKDPSLILHHLPDCWDVPKLDAGCCEAAFAAFAATVGTPDRISKRWREMQRLIANIKINDFEDVEDTQRFVAWVVFATLGGAFHVPRSQAVDFAALKKKDAAVPIIFMVMHFPTRFPGSADTLLGRGDPSHETFCGFKVNQPRAHGYQEECSHQVWELVKLLLGHEVWKTVIALDLIPLSCWANAGKCCGLGGESSIIDDFWRSLPRSFHTWYAQYTVQMIEHITQASSSDASKARATFVVGTGHACREIIESPRYKPLAILEGVSNVHMANKGSDGKSKVTWAPHLSIITRGQLWRKLTGDLERGTAQLAKFVRFAKSAGGDLQGKIVESAIKALVTAQKKKTGNPQADIIVQYVKESWVRGSSLGGHGGQQMWDFQYLLELTQRTPSSFCNDPSSKKILGGAKYQRGLDHGPSSDNDVSEVVSEFNSATPEFIRLLTTKIACLEEYGSKTRFKAGKSGNADTQFKAGESGNADTQFKAGESGNADTQFKAGKSGNADTQFKAGKSGNADTQFKTCGRFGAKGNAETYASMGALAKAIGRSKSNCSMSRALRCAKKKTSSSALRVDFKYAGLELFWDKA